VEEAWELAVVSSLYILAESLDEIVSVTENEWDSYGDMPTDRDGNVAFEDGLNYALAKIFPDNAHTAESFMCTLIGTIDDAERKVRHAPSLTQNRRRYFTTKLVRLKKSLIFPASRGSWNDFCENVCDEEFREDLKFIGEAMLDNNLAALINDEVDAMQTEVNELLALVNSSSLSVKVKQALLIQLESISSILSKYKIFGADRLEDRLKVILADTLVNYAEFVEEDKPLMGKLHSFIAQNLKRMRVTAANIEAAKTVAGLISGDQ